VRSRARDAFSPVRTLGAKISSPFGDFFGGITRYRKVKNENARLRRRLAESEGRAAQAADAVRERAELLRLAGFANPDRIRNVDARVLGGALSNLEYTVEIDRGARDGVKVDMPVVNGAGLIGRIKSTSGRRSVVLLITDPSSNVGVRLSNSGDVGLAQGQGPGRALPVRGIELSTTVAAREVLVTSGLQGSVFPSGIPVGRVRAVATPRPGEVQQRLTMDPVADLSQLTFVKVLLWAGDPQGT
jgi:rod shape-determining protein MreC